jgi:hypothetical protein
MSGRPLPLKSGVLTSSYPPLASLPCKYEPTPTLRILPLPPRVALPTNKQLWLHCSRTPSQLALSTRVPAAAKGQRALPAAQAELGGHGYSAGRGGACSSR